MKDDYILYMLTVFVLDVQRAIRTHRSVKDGQDGMIYLLETKMPANR